VGSTPEPRRFSRGRRWTAGALIVISCILVPVSVIAVWVRDQLLDTNRYVENVTPLASNPALINTIATDATDALFDRVDVQTAAKNALPDRAGFLAAPLAAEIRTVVFNTAVKVLSSDQFTTAWVTANRLAHDQLRKALTNQGKVASTANGRVELDFSSLVEQIRSALRDRGITVFDRVPADRLGLQVELLDADQLASAQRATRLLDHLSWVIPVLAFACLGGGLALSPNRRRSLLRWGIGSAFAVALVGAGVAVGRSIYLNAVTSPTLSRETAAVVFDTLVRFLREGVRLFITIGLVVAIGAWLSGPSRAAVRVRATAHAAAGSAGSAVGSRGLDFGGFGTWVGDSRAPLRVAATLVALLTLFIWPHPRGITVIALALFLLLMLATIEFIARAALAEHPAGPAPEGAATPDSTHDSTPGDAETRTITTKSPRVG
jgi:hypothetical protein